MLSGDTNTVVFIFAEGAVASVYVVSLRWPVGGVFRRRSDVALLFLGTVMRSGLLALSGAVIMFIDATAFQVLAAVVGFVGLLSRLVLRKWEAC